MITQNKIQVSTQQFIFLSSITGLSFLVTGLILLGNSYRNRIFPNTYINSIDISGLSMEQSISVLSAQKKELDEHQVVVKIDDISLASSSAELGYTTDFNRAISDTYTEQHKNHPVLNALSALLAYFQKHEYIAPKKYDAVKLEQFLTQFNQKVELIGKNPSVALKVSGSDNSIVVFPGTPGRSLAQEQTANKILEALQNDQHDITTHIASTSSVLNKDEVEHTITRAKLFVGNKVAVVTDDRKFYLYDQDLVSFINPLGEYTTDKIAEYITDWAEKVNRTSQNAEFEYNKETLKVSKFVPHKDGLEVDTDASAQTILTWLKNTETAGSEEKSKDENITTPTLALTVHKTSPETTLEKTNDLGIKERIGFGESYYHHSIPNRVHNVGITAERISMTIVPPGKEFSFNKTLGDVSASTGYRSAYVISGGKTVLGDGGGVCQVSSTLFRSVLNAGLDVTKRLQHSYRVSYYELNSDPGFDATVYAGNVDFRFINDTPGHIIIVTHNDPDELYMNVEIYGTDDGRVAEVHDYKKWGAVGPPPTEYYPTADLPHGVKKQVDWSVSGIKTEFAHTVKDKNGTVIHNDVYYSNYRPWSAKYMVGI